MEITEEYTIDENLIRLLKEIVSSFSSTELGVGLPLGNLTSQLFVNIYMNEFDQFVKHTLKAKQYIRYADDFVILSPNREWLEIILPEMQYFLENRLHLKLHPQKVSIETIYSGVDFLGWVHFTDHRVLRTATAHRMIRKLKAGRKNESVQSYRGLLGHGNANKLAERYLKQKIAAEQLF